MNIIYFLAPMALLLGFGFAASFVWATYEGQFDDTETPPLRILIDDESDDSEKRLKGRAQ